MGEIDMHDIEMHEASPEFAECWRAAMKHISQQAEGKSDIWLRAHLHPPFLEHFSFRLGNQLFFVRIEDDDQLLVMPGNSQGAKIIAEGCNGIACVMPMKKVGSRWCPLAPAWGS